MQNEVLLSSQEMGSSPFSITLVTSIMFVKKYDTSKAPNTVLILLASQNIWDLFLFLSLFSFTSFLLLLLNVKNNAIFKLISKNLISQL